MACEYCGKTLRDKKSLNKHVLAKHKRDECKYKCDLCGKNFAIRRVLVRHIAAMHTNNPNSRANLKVKEEMVPCQFCPEKFYHELLLENHQRKEHVHEMIKYKATLNPPLFANAEAVLNVDLRKVRNKRPKVSQENHEEEEEEELDQDGKPKPKKNSKLYQPIIKQEYSEDSLIPPPPGWGQAPPSWNGK